VIFLTGPSFLLTRDIFSALDELDPMCRVSDSIRGVLRPDVKGVSMGVSNVEN
jgi:hypothetical protein